MDNITFVEDLINIMNKYPLTKLGFSIGIIVAIYLLYKIILKFPRKTTPERIVLTLLGYVSFFIPFIGSGIFGIIVGNDRAEIIQIFGEIITQFTVFTYIIAVAIVIVIAIFSFAKNYIDNKYNR